MHRKLPVSVGVSSHLSGEDSGGRVCHRSLAQGHTEGHLHHSYQSTYLMRHPDY